jgi:hypothetical protein
MVDRTMQPLAFMSGTFAGAMPRCNIAIRRFIQFAAHGSLLRFHRVDGYVECEGIMFVYRFYGCYWHGYTTCHDPDAEYPHFRRPYSRVNQQTLAKEEQLYLGVRTHGAKVSDPYNLGT